MPEPAQLWGLPLLKLGVEGGGKKQRGSAAANADARLPSQRS